MKIGENTFVSLSYTLKVGGQIVDQSPEGQPLAFPFGAGYLLPKFEENIAGKQAGDKFEFTLTPGEGYGEIMSEAIIALPKSAFMVDGKVEDGLLEVGNQIPMATQDGQRMLGVVVEVTEDTATLDFNHPMAGKTLDFSGEIVEVREATEADFGHQCGGGCDCGGDASDCSEDCGCGCGN